MFPISNKQVMHLWSVRGYIGRIALLGARYKNINTLTNLELMGSGVIRGLEIGRESFISDRIVFSSAFGYRIGKIGAVIARGTASGIPRPKQQLTNRDGSEASLDYSGFTVSGSLRFYFGGKRKSFEPRNTGEEGKVGDRRLN